MFCKYCGCEANENTIFCKDCGAKLNAESNVNPQSQTTEYQPQTNINKATSRTNPAVWIVGGIAIVVIIIGFVIIFNLYKQGQAKDAQIQEYQIQQDDYENRSSAEKAMDGAVDIIDAITDIVD